VDQRHIAVPGATLYAEAHGASEGSSVVLMGSLASDVTSWQPQIEALVGAGFRALAFDFRGHGRSTPSAGPFTLDQFVEDLRAVLQRFAVRRPHLVGLSLGGMVALKAAIERGNDYSSLVIASTRADMPEPLASAWREREREVREQGVEAIVDGTLQRWFTEPFRRRNPDVLSRVREMILHTDRNAYADCIAIVRNIDLLPRLHQIQLPTLYLTGEEDVASPPALMQDMQRRTAGARFASIPGAAHLPSIEQPQAFNRLVVDFLTSLTS
jgi:3-oxoadipate enol-lactonase